MASRFDIVGAARAAVADLDLAARDLWRGALVLSAGVPPTRALAALESTV